MAPAVRSAFSAGPDREMHGHAGLPRPKKILASSIALSQHRSVCRIQKPACTISRFLARMYPTCTYQILLRALLECIYKATLASHNTSNKVPRKTALFGIIPKFDSLTV